MTPLQTCIHKLFEERIALLKQRMLKWDRVYLAALAVHGRASRLTRSPLSTRNQTKRKLYAVEELHAEFLKTIK